MSSCCNVHKRASDTGALPEQYRSSPGPAAALAAAVAKWPVDDRPSCPSSDEPASGRDIAWSSDWRRDSSWGAKEIRVIS